MKAILSVILMILLVPFVLAQEWTSDARVTSTLNPTQDIAVTRDPQNAVLHAVAIEGGALDNVYYLMIGSSGSLIDAGRISSTTSEAKQPSIAVDSLRNKHIVWADVAEVNGQYAVRYSKIDHSGGLVIDRRIIANTANTDSPQVVVDNENNAHIVWSDFRDGNWEIYYEKVGADGSMLIDDRKLTNALGLSARPNMAFDASSNLVNIAFEDNRDLDAEIYYIRLSTNGIVLSEVRVTNARGRSLSPAIAGDNGNAYIIYTDYRVGNYPELYLARVDSQNSVFERQITSEFGWPIQPSITMLPRDNEVYIVWEGHQDGNSEIYYSKRDGEHLNGNNIRLTNNVAHSAGAVIVGDVTAAIHVLWQDLRDGNWEIYHKRSVRPQQVQGRIMIDGKPAIGTTIRFNIYGPADGQYVAALARTLGSSFGLAQDDIFVTSVNSPAAVGFADSRGVFNKNDGAVVTLNIPNRRALVGQTFYFNYALVDRQPTAIAEPIAFTIQA